MTGGGPKPPGPPAELLSRWGLSVVGPVRRGHMGSVWPVQGPAGQRWVLKVTDAHHPATGEAAALRAWRGAGAPVVPVHHATGRCLVLERLDAERDLEQVVDPLAADEALADVLARLAGVAAPPGVPALADELRRMASSIRHQVSAAPGLLDHLPRPLVDRALDTLDERSTHLDGPGSAHLELVHADLHYLNVLAPLGPSVDPWLAIDPLPRAGTREVEVVAPLRNRWADATATGDPGRALRRRRDLLCERAGIDRQGATGIAQAVAVDNVLWARREGRLDSPFLPPYEVLARW